MLSQAIGELLPAAVGVALSPVPIIAVILMLGTPKARSNGPAFAGGWIAGLVVVSVIVLFVAGGADDAASATATGVNWFKVVVGVLFVAMAALQWRKRPAEGEQGAMPEWMSAIDGFDGTKSLGLGALLSGLNPKNLALTAAGAVAIAQSGVTGASAAVAIGVFVVVGSLTVAGPVLYFVLVPDRAAAPLQAVKEFLADHNAVIMMVVLLLLGVKLLGQGFGALGS